MFAIATNTGKFIEMPESILEPKFTKSVIFLCAIEFQYITTEKRQKAKQPISKTEKIKSVAEITFH